MNPFTSSERIPSRLVGAAVCLLVFLAPDEGAADPGRELPRSEMFPPDSCRSEACFLGASEFSRGNYREAARPLENGIWSKNPDMMGPRTYSDMVFLAAVARDRAGDRARAAVHFDQLAKIVDSGRSYYAFRALRAVLRAEASRAELLHRLQLRGALSTPYPGVHRLRLEYHRTLNSELPSPELVRQSLEEGDRDRVCSWLSAALAERDSENAGDESERRAELAQLSYGFCLPPRGAEAYAGQPDEPRNSARLRRAEALYDRVDFEATLEQLQKIDFGSLDRTDWCRGRFRLGRTYDRLDRDERASEAFRSVVNRCERPETVDERVRSLYALGTRALRRGDLKRARRRMKKLLEDYPQRSHADDALLYLGRIARSRGRGERERKLLRRALREYPEGDMVHEFVWESLESEIHSEDWSEFVDGLDRLELPSRDDQYFSQGRLLYFRAVAESELGLSRAALEHFRAAWREYPFSLYGYLSRLALRRRNVDPPDLGGRAARTAPTWFYDVEWNGAEVRRALRLGLPEIAAAMETGRVDRSRSSDPPRVDDGARWRLAYLHHLSGQYVESHNLARRRIAGRPWIQPARGRLTRWRVAFPAPYRGSISEAVSIEGRQRPEARVSPHLPLAIAREESGFDADIQSWAGAVGLLQLMPATARNHDGDLDVEANRETLRNPNVNIRIGVEHLHLLAAKFSDHPVVMAAAYNAGMGAVAGWLPESDGASIALWVEDVPYRQARRYAKRVIGSYAAYQWLAGERSLDPRVGQSPPTR